MGTPLEAEIKTYNDELPRLLADAGKFVLIKGDKVIDTFDAYSDALKVGYEQFEDGPFLVKRIAAAEQVAFFTRDVITECPA